MPTCIYAKCRVVFQERVIADNHPFHCNIRCFKKDLKHKHIRQMKNLVKNPHFRSCIYSECGFVFATRPIADHFAFHCSEGCYDEDMGEEIKRKSPHKKAKDEAINIAKLHAHINDDTPCGQKIKAAFRQAFPNLPMFESTVASGADRKKHHDLKLKWAEIHNIPLKTVEHKGTKEKKMIDPSQPPWVGGVQFYNGSANKFSIGNLYARKFYDTALNEIIQHFNMTTPKPTYKDWSKEAFKQGKPTSPFGLELREKGYGGDFLSECRKKFNKTFRLTDAELQQHQDEVFKRANEILQEKNFWLQIQGKMDEPDDFEVRWSGTVEVAPFLEATLDETTDCHIIYKFRCAFGAQIESILRWGYGQCITNLRMDLK